MSMSQPVVYAEDGTVKPAAPLHRRYQSPRLSDASRSKFKAAAASSPSSGVGSSPPIPRRSRTATIFVLGLFIAAVLFLLFAFDAAPMYSRQTGFTSPLHTNTPASLTHHHADSDEASSPFSTSSSPTSDLRTRVGPREYTNLYESNGCGPMDLIESVARARIEPDGSSLGEYEKAPGHGVNDIDLDGFKFSYKLDQCPPMHVFSPAEACDLLLAFGGLRIVGDSLARQFTQGLFLVLTKSFNVVRAHGRDFCSGNQVFTNVKQCRRYAIHDSADLNHLCTADPRVQYDTVWRYWSEEELHQHPEWHDHWKWPENPDWDNEGAIPPEDDQHPLVTKFNKWVENAPVDRKIYSPLYVHGTGIHYHWRTDITKRIHVEPYLSNTSEHLPRPLSFFSSYPAPAPNKPISYAHTQGPEMVQKYNSEVRELLQEESPGKVEEGAWRQLEWYNVTDGALSYDGTHYSYQVAMERAQVFLNVLDLTWTEIVARGGLVEHSFA